MRALVKRYWTVLRVGLVVLWVRLLLRFYSLPLVLDRVHPHSATGKSDDVVMRALACYVDRWLKLFPYSEKGNCFPRSLVLYRCARQLGYPVRFHCGVRKAASSLEGHAWLTLSSHVFYEPGSHWQRFTVTFSYPSDQDGDMSQISRPMSETPWPNCL